ncbi:pickpocket 13 isoform X2 [Nomia melanderi]|uniref:pickpocket 13 isoform X2 n=1 Tax=Nomia melanderi TaxID=2448451 RepID=UPI003FCD28E0
MWKRLAWWWKIIKQYLSNCSIHGVRYLVDNRLSYPERLFWLISCILCWYGCVYMIVNVLRNYIYSPVAVTVETTYVDWETPFPAIVFCVSNTKTMKKDYFKRNPGMFSNYSNPNLLRATPEELLSAYDKMRYPCMDLLADCTWNNIKFNCCSEFQELRKTGVGYCLGMNTYHLGDNSVRYFINRTVKYGDLIIDVHMAAKSKTFLLTAFSVHVFNNLQMPTFKNLEKDEIHMKAGRTTRIEFTMYDTFNGAGVENVAVGYRDCRFRHEKRRDSMFTVYSSDTCYLQLIIERMLELCGCVNFYYSVPRGARVCNGTEMLCIIANKAEITAQSIEGEEECLPNCDGTSLTIYNLIFHTVEIDGSLMSMIHQVGPTQGFILRCLVTQRCGTGDM